MQTISSFLDSLPLPAGHKIVLVDVGARWGANPPWDQVDGRYLKYIGFDADEEECLRLNALYKSSDVEYVPIGLSDAVEERQLHLTREPGCSSIFPPNQALMSRYFLSDWWDVQKKIPIKTAPLAQILADRKIEADVLKVDVQGAALQVLKGAGRYLGDSLFLEIEVEFAPMYQGEPLFAEVDALVRREGFELLDINKHYARRKVLDLAHSSRGQVLFADARYVISAEKFYGAEMSSEERARKVWSLVMIMSVYGHFDLALAFALHERSPFSKEEKAAVERLIREYTALPRWKLLLFNNYFFEKMGYGLSLLANSMQIKSRLLGWGSDQSAVDSRYKYYLTHPLLRLFRK